ncbi:unnamed protein product [Peronospora belbahrii]|uniref:Conserved oligomeric Golgi complex subunit 5 n=1 Tax=Peronospora belbahrii TaxID=622444 RepID=A0AAU9KW96_9STRA|nr:unnamed protein product [Peronospora belbahrii]
MEAVIHELESDAQMSVFLSPNCDVSAIASAVVARDSASRDGNGFAERRTSSMTSLATKNEEVEETNQCEKFVERLNGAAQRIDRVISKHIGEHHATLLDQVGSVDEMQSHLTLVQSSVGHLKESVQSLETLVREKHENLRDTIQRYRNIKRCGDIVQRLLRFQNLSDRLLGSDLNQVDAILTGVAVENGSGLTKERFQELSAVRATLPAIRKLSTNIKREVRATLRSGIRSLSQANVGDALQILFYLGELGTMTQASVNDVVQEVERKCATAISEDKLVRSGGASIDGLKSSNGLSISGNNILQKSDLWKAVQDVFDVIRVHALQVWNLQRVLLKMVDPASGKRYIDLVLKLEEPSLFATFWEVTCAIVQELFASTLNYNTAVKSVLIAEYPRMRKQATSVLNELYTATKQSAGAELVADVLVVAADAFDVKMGAVERELATVAGSAAERTQLLDSMGPLHDAFIDRAYSRMSNPIQLMFPQSSDFHASPPGRSDIQALSRAILSELEQAGRDRVLLDDVLQQVRKAVILFCSNVKRIMYQGKAAAATMPSLGRTPAQAHNVGLMNVLSLLDAAMEEVRNYVEAAAAINGSDAEIAASVSSSANVNATSVVTPKEATLLCTTSIDPCREMISDLEYAMLGSYLQALAVLLEGTFAKMHDESFGDQSAANGMACSGDAPRSSGGFRSSQGSSGSKYMQEFVNAFSVILEDHLRRLPVATFVTKCLGDFVERLVSVFIRHASLLRPLTEDGKLRLANDMTQLELQLEHIMPLRNVGASYEELRAFRHMIFLESSDILRDATVDKIRPSNVWHHLTSRAPPELQLPHQMKQLTASKYIEWLDTRANTGQPSPSTPPSSSSGKPSALSPSWKELPLGYPCLKDPRLGLQAEKKAWKEINKCLDAYSQRVSASANAELSPIYGLLQESSTILLAGYEVMVSRKK